MAIAAVTLNPPGQYASDRNLRARLRAAFDRIALVRPTTASPVRLTDAAIVGDYLRSAGDHHEDGVGRPWEDVVREVEAAVARAIAADGAFEVAGDPGAFVCS